MDERKMECTKQEGLSPDPCSCKHQDKWNHCFCGNRWESTWQQMLKKLVNHVLDTHHKKKIKSVLADGAHDTNMNFRYLEVKKIIPSIKIRSNSIVSPKNNRLRNKESKLRTKNLLKWKKKRKYGQRCVWSAETTFSSIKRMFGDYTSVTRFQNMIKEMMIKVY